MYLIYYSILCVGKKCDNPLMGAERSVKDSLVPESDFQSRLTTKVGFNVLLFLYLILISKTSI